MLSNACSGEDHPQLFEGETAGSRDVAFVFTGQGSQMLGMGRALAQSCKAFGEFLDATRSAISEHLVQDIQAIMFADDATADGALIHETQYTQPALFAFEVALARLWMDWGVHRFG